MQITLTASEMLTAALTGVQRQIVNLAAGRTDVYGAAHTSNGDGWGLHVHGALAELAVAKGLGYYPNRTDDPSSIGDVGPYEVRSTTLPSGCLIIHPDDPDERYFILVTGTAPTLTLAGYLQAAEAKQRSFWRTNVPHPAFFVPQHVLHPIIHSAI